MSDIPQQSLIEDAPDWLKPSAMQSDVIDVSFPTLLLVVFLTKLFTISSNIFIQAECCVRLPRSLKVKKEKKKKA